MNPKRPVHLVEALASERGRPDPEVFVGLRTVEHLLDIETLLQIRALLLEILPHDKASLELIDRALENRRSG